MKWTTEEKIEVENYHKIVEERNIQREKYKTQLITEFDLLTKTNVVRQFSYVTIVIIG